MPPYPRRARRLLRTPAAPPRREHPPPAIAINPGIGRNLGSTYPLACTYDPVGGEPLPSGDGGTSPAPSPLGRPFGYFKFMEHGRDPSVRAWLLRDLHRERIRPHAHRPNSSHGTNSFV